MYDLKQSFDFASVLNAPTSEASVALLKENGIQRHVQRRTSDRRVEPDEPREPAVCDEYTIYKYTRDALTEDRYATHGAFRSVVTRGERVLAISPPKSIPWSALAMEMGAQRCADVVLEEFVEGVMVNVFYDADSSYGTEVESHDAEKTETESHDAEKRKGRFVFATKTSIEGRSAFFDNGTYPTKTFGQLFREVCREVGLDLETCLDRSYSYSFVMQHPEYRIVTPNREAALVLVAVYKIDNNKLCVCNVDQGRGDAASFDAPIPGTTVRRPRQFHVAGAETMAARDLTYEHVYRMVCEDSANKGYAGLLQGICVSYYNSDGVYRRTKVRDTRHQQIKMLRGNDPKLEFHYINLRKSERVKEYLEYYPEHRALFHTYKTKIETYTRTLHQHYRETYITRRPPADREPEPPPPGTDGVGTGTETSLAVPAKASRFANVPFQYRTMLYDLHSHYIHVLRPSGERIRFEHVKEHVNRLPAARLMFALNYEKRAKRI